MKLSLPPRHEADDAPTALARRLSVFDALTTALSEPVDLTELLIRALTTVLDIDGVDGGALFLLDSRTDALTLTCHKGLGPGVVDSLTADPGPVLSNVAASADPAVVVKDIEALGTPRAVLAEDGVRSYAAIPLHVHGNTLGVLAAVSRTQPAFNTADLDLLVSVGKQIGLAIERARLYERERTRAQQLETIHEVGRQLGSILAERELLPKIVHHVRERLGYESANLLLLDESGRELILEAAIGLGNEALTGGRIPLDEHASMSGWVMAHNQPLLANDVSREPRHYRAGGHEQSELAVPIHVRGRTLGVLDVQASCTGAFHDIDVSVLQILAGQIAVAIENARLYEASQRSLRRTRAFQQVTTAVTESLDLPTTLEHALDAAMSVFEADRAALYLIYPGTRRMYCAASRNLSPAYLAAVQDYYDHQEWPVVLDVERSVYVADARASHLTPALSEAVAREGFRSMLYLTLPKGLERLGTFVMYHDRVRGYTDDEIELARTFSDQANVAIQHARLFDAEREARDQSAMILDATRAVTSSLQLDDVLRHAGASIATALRQPVCAVWLLDEEGKTFLPTYRVAKRTDQHLDGVFRSLPPMPVDDAPRIRTLIDDRQPFIVTGPNEMTEAERRIQEAMPFHAYVAVPLAARDRVIGIAAVPITDRDHQVEDSELAVAMAIARSAALAVENARLYEQSRQLAVSEERNRLARELHDSVTHSLFSITLIAQALPRILDRDIDRARERIDRLNELGRGALAEMRALIFQLRPAALEEQGLIVALTKYAEAFTSRESVEVKLTIDGEERLPMPVKEAVFRVAQEAFNNVAKHARATRVDVRLSMSSGSVELVVADDGRGFDPASPPADRRTLGMTSMRERAAIIGGACHIESTPGRGATVRLLIPLDEL